MAKELLHLHFGRQCPGTYFALQAGQTAALRAKEMGRILLRHKWEDTWLLQRRFA